MKTKKLQRAIIGLSLLTALIVAGLLLPPISQPKAQSTKIKTAVNNLPVIPAPAPSK
jgi:hypothetical protein